MKVTVAIPAYNVENYINKCLESVIHQSLGQEEYEIIIVDDGSDDNTKAIIASYYEQYPKLIKPVYRNVNSGGASIPRNDAMALAKGEYIFFLDADDYLAEETLERMYHYGKQHNSDIIIGKYVGVNGRKVPKAIFENGNVPNAEIIQNSLFYALSVLKMFKLEKIKQLSLTFSKEAIVAEDQAFTVTMLCNTDRISVLADYDCYFITKHDKGHLSDVELNAPLYFELMSKIIKTIYQGSVGDLEYKHRLVGKFVTRMFRHGQFQDFYKDTKVSEAEKRNLLSLYSTFVNLHVPKQADQYVTDIFSERLKYIRENDLYKLTIGEKLIAITNVMTKLKKENKELKKEIRMLKKKEYIN
ncbi:glycosyltransferase family 2 protein [Rummeliibacillus sp. NPDC094406]|uniref:glycosyltransferase family 2 protein n=1 Tax=Rummeliibacillus sp. NPDC094406 TaxID=3364511 RepID=UPI003825CD45